MHVQGERAFASGEEAVWPLCSVPLQVGYLFDHPGTVFFSVFMSFWAVTFLEYWKRKSATLAHHWDCMDFQEEEVGSHDHPSTAAGSVRLPPGHLAGQDGCKCVHRGSFCLLPEARGGYGWIHTSPCRERDLLPQSSGTDQ